MCAGRGDCGSFRGSHGQERAAALMSVGEEELRTASAAVDAIICAVQRQPVKLNYARHDPQT